MANDMGGMGKTHGGDFMTPFSYKAGMGTIELLGERTLGVGHGGIENTGVLKHVPSPEEVDNAWANLTARKQQLKANEQAAKIAQTYQATKAKTIDSFEKYAVGQDEVPTSIVEAIIAVIMESGEKSGLIRKVLFMGDMVNVELARRAFNPDLVVAASEKLAIGVVAIHEALEKTSQGWQLKSIAQSRFLDDAARAYAKAIGKDDSAGGPSDPGGEKNKPMSRLEIHAKFPGIHRFRVALDQRPVDYTTMPVSFASGLAALSNGVATMWSGGLFMAKPV